MTAEDEYQCLNICRETQDCKGVVFKLKAGECVLKRGNIAIIGERENARSFILPCP